MQLNNSATGVREEILLIKHKGVTQRDPHFYHIDCDSWFPPIRHKAMFQVVYYINRTLAFRAKATTKTLVECPDFEND